jgi:beta-galactosidase
VAWEQWKLPSGNAPAAPAKPAAGPIAKQPLKIVTSDPYVRMSGRDFALEFDRLNGVLMSYAYKNVPLLDRGPLPDFWRAMTDNDLGAWKAVGNAARKDPLLDILVWREAGASWKVTDAAVSRVDDESASIVVSATLPLVEAKYTMRYLVHGSGQIDVTASYEPGAKPVAMMPRFGMELIVSPGLERMAWYGRGPAETYTDRAFERVGLYSSTVDREWVEYSRPQENGHKVDVRWFELTNADGLGLRAEGLPLLGVTAHHASRRDIEQAAYTWQITPRPETFLNLDLREMGIGGVDSWSREAYPMEAYRLPANAPYTYSFKLIPIERTEAR